MLKNSQQNGQNLFNPFIMMSMLFSINADEVTRESEQHLEDLKALREFISPECTVTDEEREQHLEDLEESISLECTAEREKHLAYISYLNGNIRGQLM